MGRPKCRRRISSVPQQTWFKPAGVPMRGIGEVTLTLDEVEALRLADYEGCYQADAAERMRVSRQTLGRILGAARRKVAQALVEGQAIRLEGGNVEVHPSRRCPRCSCRWEPREPDGARDGCPRCEDSAAEADGEAPDPERDE